MRKKTIYRLSLENKSRLTEIWSIVFRGHTIAIAALIAAIGVLVIAVAIIMLTPLHTLLPGYLKESQRNRTEETLMRLDSLQNAYNLNQSYINNIMTVFDTDRLPADSVGHTSSQTTLTVDSLLETSETEKEFIRMIEQREKYNISVLAPLAAESMMLTFPVNDGIITNSSSNSEVARILSPRTSPVCAMTDGTVIDSYYSDRCGGFVVTLQHRKGFISKYSGLKAPICAIGEKLEVGQAIATGANGAVFSLELWRDGEKLIPAKYIQSASGQKHYPVLDEDIGRGR